jgi:hypothetical protein
MGTTTHDKRNSPGHPRVYLPCLGQRRSACLTPRRAEPPLSLVRRADLRLTSIVRVRHRHAIDADVLAALSITKVLPTDWSSLRSASTRVGLVLRATVHQLPGIFSWGSPRGLLVLVCRVVRAAR